MLDIKGIQKKINEINQLTEGTDPLVIKLFDKLSNAIEFKRVYDSNYGTEFEKDLKSRCEEYVDDETYHLDKAYQDYNWIRIGSRYFNLDEIWSDWEDFCNNLDKRLEPDDEGDELNESKQLNEWVIDFGGRIPVNGSKTIYVGGWYITLSKIQSEFNPEDFYYDLYIHDKESIEFSDNVETFTYNTMEECYDSIIKYLKQNGKKDIEKEPENDGDELNESILKEDFDWREHPIEPNESNTYDHNGYDVHIECSDNYLGDIKYYLEIYDPRVGEELEDKEFDDWEELVSFVEKYTSRLINADEKTEPESNGDELNENALMERSFVKFYNEPYIICMLYKEQDATWHFPFEKYIDEDKPMPFWVRHEFQDKNVVNLPELNERGDFDKDFVYIIGIMGKRGGMTVGIVTRDLSDDELWQDIFNETEDEEGNMVFSYALDDSQEFSQDGAYEELKKVRSENLRIAQQVLIEAHAETGGLIVPNYFALGEPKNDGDELNESVSSDEYEEWDGDDTEIIGVGETKKYIYKGYKIYVSASYDEYDENGDDLVVFYASISLPDGNERVFSDEGWLDLCYSVTNFIDKQFNDNEYEEPESNGDELNEAYMDVPNKKVAKLVEPFTIMPVLSFKQSEFVENKVKNIVSDIEPVPTYARFANYETRNTRDIIQVDMDENIARIIECDNAGFHYVYNFGIMVEEDMDVLLMYLGYEDNGDNTFTYYNGDIINKNDVLKKVNNLIEKEVEKGVTHLYELHKKYGGTMITNDMDAGEPESEGDELNESVLMEMPASNYTTFDIEPYILCDADYPTDDDGNVIEDLEPFLPFYDYVNRSERLPSWLTEGRSRTDYLPMPKLNKDLDEDIVCIVAIPGYYDGMSVGIIMIDEDEYIDANYTCVEADNGRPIAYTKDEEYRYGQDQTIYTREQVEQHVNAIFERELEKARNVLIEIHAQEGGRIVPSGYAMKEPDTEGDELNESEENSSWERYFEALCSRNDGFRSYYKLRIFDDNEKDYTEITFDNWNDLVRNAKRYARYPEPDPEESGEEYMESLNESWLPGVEWLDEPIAYGENKTFYADGYDFNIESNSDSDGEYYYLIIYRHDIEDDDRARVQEASLGSWDSMALAIKDFLREKNKENEYYKEPESDGDELNERFDMKTIKKMIKDIVETADGRKISSL